MKIVTPLSLKSQYPLDGEMNAFILQSRETVCNILNGKDKRLLLIAGPCSIHDLDSALEYAVRLKQLAEQVKDHYFVIMRTYFEKPRTKMGWKGIVQDPHLDGSFAINTGLEWTRCFLSKLAKLKMPAACEFLEPHSPAYFEDLISWSCIGARTSSSQVHRQMASSLSMPVGFKNNPDGNIAQAVQGAAAACHPSAHLSIDQSGTLALQKSNGNPFAHVVLRGGKEGANYDANHVAYTEALLKCENLIESILIDCSHDNSGKKWENQLTVFQEVLKQKEAGNESIKGMLLESFLHAGNQSFNAPFAYGVSVTDECMDWETTEALVYQCLLSGAL